MSYDYYVYVRQTPEHSEKILQKIYHDIENIAEKSGFSLDHLPYFEVYPLNETIKIYKDELEHFRQLEGQVQKALGVDYQKGSTIIFSAFEVFDSPFCDHFFREAHEKLPFLYIETEKKDSMSLEEFWECNSLFSYSERKPLLQQLRQGSTALIEDINKVIHLSVLELTQIDLNEIFRYKNIHEYSKLDEVRQSLGDYNTPLEELLASGTDDHLTLANRKIEIDGIKLSPIIETHLAQFENAVDKITKQKSLTILFNIHLLYENKNGPNFVNKAIKIDYVKNSRDQLLKFLEKHR